MILESISYQFNIALLIAIICLLVTLIIGLIRVLIGPSIEDRFLSILLLGSGGVALLFLLALLKQASAFYDVALVLALLASVITVALTRRNSVHD